MLRLTSSFRLAGHPLFLPLAAALLFIQVWMFWPSGLDKTPDSSKGGPLREEPTALEPEPRFPGFDPPEGATPDYGIQGFRYISVLKGQKQWQLDARDADFYSKDQWVYARSVKAELFNGDQPSIQVEGQFARYSLVSRNLDLGGQVVARFVDGTSLQMELLEFRPTQRRVSVPIKYRVRGTGPREAPAQLRFESNGLEGDLQSGAFELPSLAFTEVQGRDRRSPPTRVWAPSATYRRTEGTVSFVGGGKGAPKTNSAVRLEQGSLRATSQQMEASLPHRSKKASFAAWEDVRIEEWKNPGRNARPDRYSTCGRAEFDPDQQVAVLSEYPQVYQDGDTMTGEVIRILRKEDQVEVENTNAFTRGGGF
jgi:lipopolysaccharide export system protein LptA